VSCYLFPVTDAANVRAVTKTLQRITTKQKCLEITRVTGPDVIARKAAPSLM
jgi:hypothetical protein